MSVTLESSRRNCFLANGSPSVDLCTFEYAVSNYRKMIDMNRSTFDALAALFANLHFGICRKCTNRCPDSGGRRYSSKRSFANNNSQFVIKGEES